MVIFFLFGLTLKKGRPYYVEDIKLNIWGYNQFQHFRQTCVKEYAMTIYYHYKPATFSILITEYIPTSGYRYDCCHSVIIAQNNYITAAHTCIYIDSTVLKLSYQIAFGVFTYLYSSRRV